MAGTTYVKLQLIEPTSEPHGEKGSSHVPSPSSSRIQGMMEDYKRLSCYTANEVQMNETGSGLHGKKGVAGTSTYNIFWFSLCLKNF